MSKYKNYSVTQPHDIPESAGVFAIARYINKNSNNFEILHCDESENIKDTVVKIMTEKKFDGFDNSIIYLVLLESDPEKRNELLHTLRT